MKPRKPVPAQAQIQAATAQGKLVVVVHNGAPHFAKWNAEKGAIEYEPCPRRNPRVDFRGLKP